MKNKKISFRSYRENCVKTVKDLIIAIALCLIMFAGLLAALPIIAYADEPEYSGVLEDLQKDVAFDVSEYDNVLKHPKTELIQISESKSNELFLYVHFVGDIKPLSKVVFNTSTVFTSLDFRSYTIEPVNNSGNFYKYVVKEYTVSTNDDHMYSITRLEYAVDKPIEGTQQTTYEYIPVEQIWTVQRKSGNVTYSYQYLQTILITDKYVGSHNGGVDGGFGWADYKSWTDTFYIAFNTDLRMDKLIEAQIEYSINTAVPSGKIIYKGDTVYPVVINCDEVAEFENDTYDTWWFVSWRGSVDKRTFKRILKPSDFKKNTGISIPKRADGSDYEWVVTFYNKKYTFDWPGEKVSSWSIPADTSILRLKFETDGVCYNLGVLDTRTSYIPPKLQTQSYWWILWLVLGILIVVLCLCFISPLTTVLSGVLKGLFTLLTWLFKAIIWVISLPIRLIAALFGGGK